MNCKRFNIVSILTDTWPWWWVGCRGPYWAPRSCCTWTAAVDGACACGRSRAATGCSAAAPRAGRTWRRSLRMASCCLWSIAAERNNKTVCYKGNEEHFEHVDGHHLESHLVHFSAVLERTRVVDVVHQADHVACQVGLGQEVKIWRHLVQLVVSEQEKKQMIGDGGIKRQRRTDAVTRSDCSAVIRRASAQNKRFLPAGTSPDRKRRSYWWHSRTYGLLWSVSVSVVDNKVNIIKGAFFLLK